MSSQKVCDGCGQTARYKAARGEWARLYVPNDSLFMKSLSEDVDTPEFDLCPNCFRSIQSILTALPRSEASNTE
ncbi:hypothetical protein [Mycobacterium sp.]|jgi:hypothetical protein|uniref:hypothetical protein n=1 Tax=Mycobacterium sp. TaxID=1785 RepID=UPI0025E6BE2E|nr:hypothetical protein [Mycobacterium sp.]